MSYHTTRAPAVGAGHLFESDAVEEAGLGETVDDFTSEAVESLCGGVERHGPFASFDGVGEDSVCENCQVARRAREREDDE